jgi:microcystin-dependent protein
LNVLTRDIYDKLDRLSSGGGSSSTVVAANEIGSIQLWAGSTVPDEFLACDGSAVSRTTYSALFSVIGTTYGSGDGSTTFNLPDLCGRVPVGSGAGSGLTARTLADTGGEEEHTLTEDEIPTHSHLQYVTANSGSWAIRRDFSSDGSCARYSQGLNTGEAGGDDPHNNMQPFLVLTYIIRYTAENVGPTGPTGAAGAPGAGLPGQRTGLNLSYVDADTVQIGTGYGVDKAQSLITVSSAIDVDMPGDLDTGSEAGSRWYYVYLSTSSVGKLSATTPTVLNSGLHPTQNWVYVGAVRNDGSSDFYDFDQSGKWFTYASVQTANSDNQWTSSTYFDSLALPMSMGRFKINRQHGHTSAGWNGTFLSADGTNWLLHIQTGYQTAWHRSETTGVVPVPSSGCLYQCYNSTNISGTAYNSTYTIGWLDPWLP